MYLGLYYEQSLRVEFPAGPNSHNLDEFLPPESRVTATASVRVAVLSHSDGFDRFRSRGLAEGAATAAAAAELAQQAIVIFHTTAGIDTLGNALLLFFLIRKDGKRRRPAHAELHTSCALAGNLRVHRGRRRSFSPRNRVRDLNYFTLTHHMHIESAFDPLHFHMSDTSVSKIAFDV
jgi:hypothetical protein